MTIKKVTKKPFSAEKDFGYFKCEMNLQDLYMAKGLPKTSMALQRTCKQEIKDDANLNTTKENDYTTSLKELLHTLDVFIKETKTQNNKNAVEATDFQLSNPQELTLYLFWQIRHILTHSGGTIDDKCLNEYELKYKKAQLQGIIPSLDIPPDTLSIGELFIIEHEYYAHLKECLFEYIQNRVSINQFNALYQLGSISYGTPKLSCLNFIGFDRYGFQFNIEDAYQNDFDMEYMQRYGRFPNDADYDFETEKIVMANGKSFPAKLIGKRFHEINFDNSMNKYITMSHENLVLRINLQEACACGCKLHLITKQLMFPAAYSYDEKQEKFVLENGKSFSAQNVLDIFEPTHPLYSQF